MTREGEKEMNAIIFSESGTLKVYYEVARRLKSLMSLDRVGLQVCDTRYYLQFVKERPEIESGEFELFREWEIIRESKRIKPDIARLREYEKRLGDPVLWNAIVAERRIYTGPMSTVEQDYTMRYSHERMMAILQLGVERMEAFFDRIRPDFIVSFLCNTLSNYLGYLVAESRGIPVLNLRPSRVGQYIHIGDTITWPSKRAEEAYRDFLENGIGEELKKEARGILEGFRDRNVKYEGATLTRNARKEGDRPNTEETARESLPARVARAARGFARENYRFYFGYYRDDNWVPSVMKTVWSRRVKQPLRVKMINAALGRRYVRKEELPGLDYAFYGMHTEPEVSLLVYSRPYLNQIEVVRSFARSLPVGMKLIVKEHPWCVGKRPLSYYRKLLNIPNVILADPAMESRALIDEAALIVSVSGSMLIEAAMLGKPGISLGDGPFNCLPPTMLRRVTEPDRLAGEIADLLESFEYDEDVVLSYIASYVKTSVPIDYYTRLLKRKEAWTKDFTESEDENERQMNALVEHIRDVAVARVSEG